MLSAIILILVVVALVALAAPASVRRRVRRYVLPRRRKHRPWEGRGYVWQVSEAAMQSDGQAESETASLEHSEQALAAARLAGTLGPAGYREEMARVARLDDGRRPVRVPLRRGGWS